MEHEETDSQGSRRLAAAAIHAGEIIIVALLFDEFCMLMMMSFWRGMTGPAFLPVFCVQPLLLSELLLGS